MIVISKEPFPSVTFEYDLLLAEGRHPSEKEFATHNQALVNAGDGDVLETRKGYYGYPEFVFLRYILQGNQQLFARKEGHSETAKSQMKPYLSIASDKGVASGNAVNVVGWGVKRWMSNTAQQLGTDLLHADTWLSELHTPTR